MMREFNSRLPPVIRPERSARPSVCQKKVLTIFGTRPELIKLAPVMLQLERLHCSIRTINVASGQHADLLTPLIDLFGIRVDENLRTMRFDQTPDSLRRRILLGLGPLVDKECPDLILVQGDTETALAGAMIGYGRGIPVGHVEAGLRSGCLSSPYPEEMNRRLITRLATYHFAATNRNRDLLLSEGIASERIFLTGNPLVDSLLFVLRQPTSGDRVNSLLRKTSRLKRIALTTHRRESFGNALGENLRVLCRFVREHDDVALIFPVHPNPNVKAAAKEICAGRPRVILTEPLDYRNFVDLLSNTWLIVSDSGGIQEEAPSLGKPLLILRENTERPESIDAGVARLVGSRPGTLCAMLEEAYRKGSWAEHVGKVHNPFGDGRSGPRIAACVAGLVGTTIGQDGHQRPIAPAYGQANTSAV